MRAIKILLIFTFLGNFGNSFAQSSVIIEDSSGASIPDTVFYVFGEPRLPSESSFYNQPLYVGDWRRSQLAENGIVEKKLTFLGIENRVKTNGKTIVFDAAESAISTKYELKGYDNVTLTKEKVFVENDGRVHQVPVEFDGENAANADVITKVAKSGLSEYVVESFKFSGATPSKIKIKVSDDSYDLFIFKSNFTSDEIVIKRFNVMTSNAIKLDDDLYLVIETEDVLN